MSRPRAFPVLISHGADAEKRGETALQRLRHLCWINEPEELELKQQRPSFAKAIAAEHSVAEADRSAVVTGELRVGGE